MVPPTHWPTQLKYCQAQGLLCASLLTVKLISRVSVGTVPHSKEMRGLLQPHLRFLSLKVRAVTPATFQPHEGWDATSLAVCTEGAVKPLSRIVPYRHAIFSVLK